MKKTLGIVSLGLCFLALESGLSSIAYGGPVCMKHCTKDCHYNDPSSDCIEECYYCTVPEWQTPKY